MKNEVNSLWVNTGRMSKKVLSVALLFFCFAMGVNAQGKIGSILHGVKDKTQTVKSTVDLVKPEETKKEETTNTSQNTTSTQQDTSKSTNAGSQNTGGTTNNLAIGDQGTNNNTDKSNSKDKKNNQVKDFVKGSKDSDKEKPYSNGTTPTSNLAIGEQGSVENTNSNKGNGNTNNNVQPNQNTNISPK
jgi:hypothetical protein